MKYFRVSCALPSPQSLINNTASGVSHRNVYTSVVGKVGVGLARTRPWGLEGEGCVCGGVLEEALCATAKVLTKVQRGGAKVGSLN